MSAPPKAERSALNLLVCEIHFVVAVVAKLEDGVELASRHEMQDALSLTRRPIHHTTAVRLEIQQEDRVALGVHDVHLLRVARRRRRRTRRRLAAAAVRRGGPGAGRGAQLAEAGHARLGRGPAGTQARGLREARERPPAGDQLALVRVVQLHRRRAHRVLADRAARHEAALHSVPLQ